MPQRADDAAPGARRPDLALFDFDGTLTTRETFGPFIAAAVPRWRLWAGTVLLSPLVLAYRAGLVPGTAVRACIVWVAFRGLRHGPVDAAARRFAASFLPGVLHETGMARLRWHQARGDVVAVVSGAFDSYLRPWCEAQHVAVIASHLETVDGVLSGRYAGAQCVGAEKARRVDAAFDRAAFGAVHAYGDTAEDAALLALADHATYRWQAPA